MVHRKRFITIAPMEIHFIRRTNSMRQMKLILYTFQQISDLHIFAECFRGPLKALWRPTNRPPLI